MVPTMAALSFMRGALPVRRWRASGRVTVVAWAIALAALGGAGASAVLGEAGGARAMVVATPPEAHHDPAEAAAPEAVETPDPASFRREAPPADGRPRIAIIVRGLGLSQKLTADAVALPPDISLGLSAYGHGLQKQVDAARAAGHEVYLDVPVEPLGSPNNDAGPKALLTDLGAAENAERLAWALARATGFPGVVFAAGSPALDDGAVVAPLAASPAAAGLIWVHARGRGVAAGQVIQAAATLVLDAKPNAHDIEAALGQLEAAARKSGSAIGFANAYPVTLAQLAAWSAGLEERGIQLVPVSALSVAPGS